VTKTKLLNIYYKTEREELFMSKNIYQPIKQKIADWIWYDDGKPTSKYLENPKEHDEYRRWHDRDCVLTGGNLYADTMFSLWLPLRHTIARINTQDAIREVGDMNQKVDFLRALNQGNNLEKLLPEKLSIVRTLSELFELGLGRENVFILTDRSLNTARGRRPYWDYMPHFLYELFEGGDFANRFENDKEVVAWILSEHLEVLFEDAIIDREHIKDLSGGGDVHISLAPEGLEAQEQLLQNYIHILKLRRSVMDKDELAQGEERAKIMCMDQHIHEYAKSQLFQQDMEKFRQCMNMESKRTHG
jgi:hypothetical protein